MEKDLDQIGKDDEKTSIGDTSSLNFNLLDEDKTETVAGTTEPAEYKISLWKLPQPL